MNGALSSVCWIFFYETTPVGKCTLRVFARRRVGKQSGLRSHEPRPQRSLDVRSHGLVLGSPSLDLVWGHGGRSLACAACGAIVRCLLVRRYRARLTSLLAPRARARGACAPALPAGEIVSMIPRVTRAYIVLAASPSSSGTIIRSFWNVVARARVVFLDPRQERRVRPDRPSVLGPAYAPSPHVDRAKIGRGLLRVK